MNTGPKTYTPFNNAINPVYFLSILSRKEIILKLWATSVDILMEDSVSVCAKCIEILFKIFAMSSLCKTARIISHITLHLSQAYFGRTYTLWTKHLMFLYFRDIFSTLFECRNTQQTLFRFLWRGKAFIRGLQSEEHRAHLVFRPKWILAAKYILNLRIEIHIDSKCIVLFSPIMNHVCLRNVSEGNRAV